MANGYIDQITLPDNSSYNLYATKLTLTSSLTNSSFPIILAPNGTLTSGDAQSAYYNSDIYANPSAGAITAVKVYNAVWNDYAECRNVETEDPGYCVKETESGQMIKTTKRLQPGCKITSDTYGTCMGETEIAKTPIAVAGRVLAYPYRNRKKYHIGAAVCSAPNGTIDVMSRLETILYPDRIVGTVSEIPDYEVWHGGTEKNPYNIQVNGRIWIYVR